MRGRINLSHAKSTPSGRFFGSHRLDASKRSFFTSSVSGEAGPIQRKLRLGAPNDKFEQEADAVADRIVSRMGSGDIAENRAEQIQTKCLECEREEKEKLRRYAEDPESENVVRGQVEPGEGEEGIQRALESEEPDEEMLRPKSEAGERPSSGVRQAASAVSSGGRPLTSVERGRFEPHFGRAFSGVRIHEDAAAGAAARRIRAKAYTLGNDIAFAPGQYSPGSQAGVHLMAHELTHVVQQGKATTLRRAPPKPKGLPSAMPAAGPSDFKIERVPASSESRITFARNEKKITASAAAAVAAIKKAKPASVKVLGFVSMDENPSLAGERAQVVKKALEKSPDKVTVTSAKGNPTAMAASADFGTARSVEVIAAGKTASTLDCKAVDPATGAKKHPPKEPCPVMDPDTWTDFNAAWIIAKDAMEKAVDSIKKTKSNPTGKPSAGATALIDQFFGNHNKSTLDTLRNNLSRLKVHVDGLDKITSCGGQCDIGGCSGGGVIAYNNDVDAASRMTLCVPVFKNMNKNDQARNLIHESAHGTTPLGGPTEPTKGTRDVAYRHERMMFSLKPADRLRNSDSYALFAMFLREVLKTGSATAKPAGIATPALLLVSGFSTTEESALTLSIAKLEKRLAWAKSWTGQLFGEATKIKDRKYAWSASWAENLMKEAAARFPLTAPPAEPTKTDLVRLASVVERYIRMSMGSKQALGISRKAAGVVDWPAGTGFLADTQLRIGPDFFKANADDQVSLLLQALAAATKDVETAFIPAYSSLARWIHRQNP